MVCSDCSAVFSQPLTLVQNTWQGEHWQSLYEYPVTLSGLEQRADHCYGCRGIFRQFIAAQEKSNSPRFQGENQMQVRYLLSVPTDEKKLGILLRNSVVMDGMKLGIQPACLERITAKEEAIVDSSNTSSKETLELVKGWLDECLAHHKTCSATTPTEEWRPTRLIEVQQDSLKLVESSQISVSEPYASLSHCWGGAIILRLEADTLASFKDDIPFSKLPKNFQDAILVLRGLGLKYIWIDSLCIIQDSDEDWRKEALLMIKVYQYALCNIAASNSKDSHKGFFKERNLGLVADNVLKIDNGPLKGQFRFVDETYFTQEVDDAPLNRRCWVVQERILSGRIIHFASDQVIWDCKGLTACESMPKGTNIWARPHVHEKIGPKHRSQFSTVPKSLDEGLSQWAKIVNAYSSCGLSFLGDRLIAISGMAEHMRNRLNLKYCAGMWHPYKLEIQLAWHVGKLQPQDSHRNHLAPSWSWVSVNNPVKTQKIDSYEGYDIIPLATIAEVSIHEERWEDRSMTMTGPLRIRCFLNPVKLKGDTENPQLEGDGMEHAARVWIDSPDVIGAERLFVIPLFDLQTPMSLKDKWNIASEIRGILLQGENGNPGTYRRCGHVLLSGKVVKQTREFEPTYEGLRLAPGKADLPCINFDSSSGHLIILV